MQDIIYISNSLTLIREDKSREIWDGVTLTKNISDRNYTISSNSVDLASFPIENTNYIAHQGSLNFNNININYNPIFTFFQFEKSGSLGTASFNIYSSSYNKVSITNKDTSSYYNNGILYLNESQSYNISVTGSGGTASYELYVNDITSNTNIFSLVTSSNSNYIISTSLTPQLNHKYQITSSIDFSEIV